MEFRISDTFTDSLSRLASDEQKAVKTSAFDLQMNPASPGLQFHKIEKSKDKNFWSVRVNKDVRLIVHKTNASLLLCYVDHHDKAYAWAERRKLETHPKTGAAQFVEIRTTIREIETPVAAATHSDSNAPAKPLLFALISDEGLLDLGVPPDWIGEVRKATEDTILNLAAHLPAEAAEALLEIATGGKPQPRKVDAVAQNPFEHPDAQRRFRTLKNVDELKQALDYPWEKWTVFLHPDQRQIVERDYNGPARVAGTAGTGKTIVALHRAVALARKHANARVLLTTFAETLASALRTKLKRLTASEPKLAERIDVHSLDAIGRRLHKSHLGPITLASQSDIRNAVQQAAASVPGHKFSLHFLQSEWEQIVDAWDLQSWEGYRDVNRLGRKTRLPEPQRKTLWDIFEKVREQLKSQSLVTTAEMFTTIARTTSKAKTPVFDFAVVDEAQDISIAQLKFLAALGGSRKNSLFFAGDLGQRIFQQPFSWKSLGVDVRGRSKTLKVNYRTSHQIRTHADRLLGPAVSDVDGNIEERKGAVSVFNGPPPEIATFKSEKTESAAVGKWLKARLSEGVLPHEIGIFVRSDAQIERAKAAASSAGVPFKILDDKVDTMSGNTSICTMHLAKGLEFRCVAVMACDDEVLPLQERIDNIGDDADLQEVYNTERHLLYVACTRARDHLMVCGVAPVSEFLEDLSQTNRRSPPKV